MSGAPVPSGQELSSAPLINEFAPRRAFLARFRRWEWMLAGLILVVFVLNSVLSPYFLNAENLSRTSSDFMEIGLMMLPMVFIIITGNIDLSIASNLGMSASLMAVLYNLHVNIWLAALAALFIGALGGLLNGYLISKVKLPALVVTLGNYASYRGLAYGLLGDQAATNYPSAFTYLGQGIITIYPGAFFRGAFHRTGNHLWTRFAPHHVSPFYVCDREQPGCSNFFRCPCRPKQDHYLYLIGDYGCPGRIDPGGALRRHSPISAPGWN